ncbi:hypothetical protein B4098_2859 [Heyndrickxia coagulans]|uniref:Uncharacterized protein n=1 Tax=Heyndrickxia coagulans TaxID=1398 RepID=A0A150K7F2_HEYCO|nr:hypothetical protein B4098_2859 [Heyndrickxia coagulans]
MILNFRKTLHSFCSKQGRHFCNVPEIRFLYKSLNFCLRLSYDMDSYS